MHWGIRWATLQRILIDAPGYKPNKSTDGKKAAEPVAQRLTEKDADAIMSRFGIS